MADKNLQGLRVAILATDGVEDAELKDPRKALDNAGAKTTLIAPKAGKIQSLNHSDKASQYDVDETLDQVRADQFDAVLLPGGALNADTLRVHPRAQEFVRQIEPVREADCGYLPCALVAGFGWTGERPIHDQLSHHSGRYSECWGQMAGRRSRSGQELGEQPPAVRHPGV